VKQHPSLRFEFYNEEEQGWGVVYEGKKGKLKEVASWGIPEEDSQ